MIYENDSNKTNYSEEFVSRCFSLIEELTSISFAFLFLKVFHNFSSFVENLYRTFSKHIVPPTKKFKAFYRLIIAQMTAFKDLGCFNEFSVLCFNYNK